MKNIDHEIIDTPEKIIENVIYSYKEARKSIISHSKVKRGRSHSISSRVEDILSIYLANKLIDTNFYIDQPTTVSGRKNPIYPDIMIVNNQKEVLNLIDLKMDLGWNRKGFVDFCKKKEELINEIKGGKCSIKDGNTKVEENLSISINAKYHIVIVSDKNISEKQMQSNFNELSTLTLGNVCVYILTSAVHPNTYDEAKLKNIKINFNEFHRLLENIK
jgi:hypothetical protein